MSAMADQQHGPWFNIKMTSYQYRKSHYGDKTILRPSYLHNGISYTGKMTSFYSIGPQGPVSISDKTHYRKISWSLEVGRLVLRMIRSLWNLTGTSTTLLPMCLSNFKTKRWVKLSISRIWDFTRTYQKTSYRILKRDSGCCRLDWCSTVWKAWKRMKYDKGRARPTACTIVPRISLNNDSYFCLLVMVGCNTNILITIKGGMGKLKMHSAIYCIEDISDDRNYISHTLGRMHMVSIFYGPCLKTSLLRVDENAIALCK